MMTYRISKTLPTWKQLVAGIAASALALGGTTAASANDSGELPPAGTSIIQAEGTPDAARMAQVGAVVVTAILLAAGFVPGGAIGGVVTGLITLGVGFLNVCENWSSNGAIYLNGGSPLVPPSCWRQ